MSGGPRATSVVGRWSGDPAATEEEEPRMTNTQLETASDQGAAPLTLGAITHVALTVSDLPRSVAWYQRLVGAEPALDEDTGPFHHTVFALGGTLLGLHAFP